MRVKLVRRKKTRTSGSKEHEKQRFYINIFFTNVCVFNPRDGLRRKRGTAGSPASSHKNTPSDKR